MSNEDEVSTQIIAKLTSLPRVPTVDDLPIDGVPEGAMCFVEADKEEEVWQFKDGAWIRVDML